MATINDLPNEVTIGGSVGQPNLEPFVFFPDPSAHLHLPPVAPEAGVLRVSPLGLVGRSASATVSTFV